MELLDSARLDDPDRSLIINECRSTCHRPTSVWTLFLALALTFVSCLVSSAAPNPSELAAWPNDRQSLVFVWQDDSAANEITDDAGKVVRICRVQARGRAKFGRYFGMDATHGWFEAEDVGAVIAEAVRKSGEFAMEAMVTPNAPTPGQEVQIIGCAVGAKDKNFALLQNQDHLVFQLTTSAGSLRDQFGPLKSGRPAHVVISFTSGGMVSYLNGRRVSDTTIKAADLKSWGHQPLIFGSGNHATSKWAGTIEAVAIYSRALVADEVTANFELQQARMADHQPAERIVVDAELLEVSETPQLEDIAPYARALAVYTYAVERVIEGKCEDKKIQVAHWVIMDREELPNARQPGQVHQLTLERFEDHEQLESERLVSDSEDFDLPLFYAVNGSP